MPDLRLPAANFERVDHATPPARLINWFVEQAPEDPSRGFNLLPRPGHLDFATLTSGTAPQGMFYSPGVAGGHIYAVASGNVYKVESSATVTNIGTVANTTGAVRFAATITQLFLLDASGNIYEVTASAVTLQTISALAGETIVDIAGINGRVVFLASDGDFYWSEVLAGGTVLGLSLANAERDADAGVGLVVDKQELWVFGQRTIEVQVDTGQAAEYTFASVSGAVIDRGCVSKHTIVRRDNSIFWLGDDGVYYRANGYTPQRISTHGEEERFRKDIDAGNAASIRAWSYTQDGHAFIAVRTPNQGCHVFDIATGLWHERKSASSSTYTPFHVLNAFNEKPHILEASAVRTLGVTTYTDDGTAISREATAYIPARGYGPMFNFALDGVASAEWTLETSDDDGTTFTSRGAKTGINPKWRAMGRITPPGRVIRITTSSAVDTTLRGARYNDREL